MNLEVDKSEQRTGVHVDLRKGLVVKQGEESICNLGQRNNGTNKLIKWLDALNKLVQRGETHLVLMSLKPEETLPGSRAVKIVDFNIDPDSLGKNSSKKVVTFFGKLVRRVEIIQMSFDPDGNLHGEFELR